MRRSGIGHVFFRIRGRSAVFVGIDAEHGEVARVPRPHPVVGIAAELTDRGGRSAHQPHVAVHLADEHQVLVASEKVLDLDALRRTVQDGLLLDLFDQFGDLLVARRLGQRIAQLRQDAVRHVDDLADEGDAEARRGNLLGVGHGPETVLKIIVLDAAVLLDGPVTAVVVGENQSPVRDDLAGTAVAENNDGVLDGVAVDVVDVFGGEFEPFGFHILDIQLLEIGKQPHSLVRPESRRREQQRQTGHHDLFHCLCLSFYVCDSNIRCTARRRLPPDRTAHQPRRTANILRMEPSARRRTSSSMSTSGFSSRSARYIFSSVTIFM